SVRAVAVGDTRGGIRGVGAAYGGGGRSVAERLRLVGGGPDVPTEQAIRALPGVHAGIRGVEGDGVHHRVEPVVVGATGVEHLPDHLEPAVVTEGLRR